MVHTWERDSKVHEKYVKMCLLINKMDPEKNIAQRNSDAKTMKW